MHVSFAFPDKYSSAVTNADAFPAAVAHEGLGLCFQGILMLMHNWIMHFNVRVCRTSYVLTQSEGPMTYDRALADAVLTRTLHEFGGGCWVLGIA